MRLNERLNHKVEELVLERNPLEDPDRKAGVLAVVEPARHRRYGGGAICRHRIAELDPVPAVRGPDRVDQGVEVGRVSHGRVVLH